MNASEIPSLESSFIEALKSLQAGEILTSRQAFESIVRDYPDCKEAWYHLGEICQKWGDFENAIDHYTHVLELDPAIQEVYNNLGVIATLQGLPDLASGYFFKALEINSEFAPAHLNLGQLFLPLGQYDLFAYHCLQALNIDASLERTYFQTGMNALLKGDFTQAEALFSVIVKYSGTLRVSALLKKTFCLQRLGRDSEALGCLDQAYELDPDGTIALMRAFYLPVVYRSEAELNQWRDQLTAKLETLEAEQANLSFRRLHEMDWYPFYLAYQGQNDLEIMQRLARLIQPHVPALSPLQEKRPREKNLRVGWVSRYFHTHSVAQCFLPVLNNFPKGTVHLLFQVPGSRQDLMPGRFQAAIAAVLPLSEVLAQAQEQIQAQELDILIYTDLGMEPFGFLLAQNRLAPLQYLLPGHPVTSGLKSLDGFISSRVLEGPDAQQHYQEPLVLLDHPLVNFPNQAQHPVIERAQTGLPAGRLYACPVTLFKLHPGFDKVFAALLAADPEAQILCFQDQSPEIAAILKTRWQELLGPDSERMHLLPWQSAERFQELLPHFDLVLDPFPFGLGTTAYLALQAEVPMVSWPGEFLRGRVVQALYQTLGIQTGLATSLEDYVTQALALAQNPELRQAWIQTLRQQKHLLFESSLGGQELAVFLQDAQARKLQQETV
ncbi:hypothetical protein COW36_05545 [bacterium (Candidatus Blackallbacteria) CG17_big_fil_post_rev_8_21_14_2_50_48_46]|uniref:Uncharacterized protein n=1 Tax=bacterium (Candidatus Blackallbacteria) CG17_big_fil_post_rev_8_21_14_2_50_48_46 TaxID=2014261 RepID=A0A2M7G828_9BACT|nr:MAG: hypothetical protein COW64_21140 [bacterium (Candidatus Blackallbacteria) CG18_big_fil_WC_8_21_14_2_50_49_26]PIW18232.1 MAG: hypothetical protein COW36_05545 [bacterium (Candidatus Blackallbacteria) CG17_big_fil_post_rev_8_21_14_2_50_48_46]PIW50663.1 MAG: hypothetical protein COW20_01810 [bacterium (Candidatus Blackallbacteria) CG13_big_fil_rev_8_21_14_2_50_49_14]